MNFSEILKTAIFQILNSIRFCDIYIAEVLQDNPLKIKIQDKVLLEDKHIIKSIKFQNGVLKGEKIILIKESGGQRYFAIDYIAKC